MSRFVIDMPDDFKNELLKRKARHGLGMKYQVLNALRKEFGWDENVMPVDARYAVILAPPQPKTNGHTPKNVPLNHEGNPDFEPALERAEEASRPATHPEDQYYKSPDDKPYPGADPKAVIGTEEF